MTYNANCSIFNASRVPGFFGVIEPITLCFQYKQCQMNHTDHTHTISCSRRGAPFYPRFRHLLRLLEEAGITNHWMENVIATRVKSTRKTLTHTNVNRKITAVQVEAGAPEA